MIHVTCCRTLDNIQFGWHVGPTGSVYCDRDMAFYGPCMQFAGGGAGAGVGDMKGHGKGETTNEEKWVLRCF